MNFEELQLLVQQGESETLEFKTSTGLLKAIFKTICAFLNTNGGIVLIGVTNKGNIIGQEVSDATQLTITDMIPRFEPSARIDIKIIPINKENKKVICIRVESCKKKRPFLFDGKAYERIASSTRRMSHERLQELFSEKIQITMPWDHWISGDVTYNDLDENEILNFYGDAVKSGRADEEAAKTPQEILFAFNLMDESLDRVTNAAVVLFAKRLPRSFSHCYIKLIKFNGIDKKEIFDSKKIHGNAFLLLNEAMTFIRRNMRIASEFAEGEVKRRDTPEFPLVALRESVINSLTHRAYDDHAGYVEIAMYDDRIEIASKGDLPQSISLEMLTKRHKSVPRNELIANVMFRRGFIEQMGRGTNLILDECRKLNIPDPEFSIDQGFFEVKIPSVLWGERTAFNLNNIKDVNFTDRQQSILHILYSSGTLSTVQIAEKMGGTVTQRSIQRDLSALEEQKFVEKMGEARASAWRLTKLLREIATVSRQNRDNRDKIATISPQ